MASSHARLTFLINVTLMSILPTWVCTFSPHNLTMLFFQLDIFVHNLVNLTIHNFLNQFRSDVFIRYAFSSFPHFSATSSKVVSMTMSDLQNLEIWRFVASLEIGELGILHKPKT